MTAPFIRRGAQVTPRDLSEAGVDGANLSPHLLPGVIGSLHSLACTREECVCRPLIVRETTAGECESAYNSMTAVEADHSKIAHGVPVVLNPLSGRRSASSRLSR